MQSCSVKSKLALCRVFPSPGYQHSHKQPFQSVVKLWQVRVWCLCWLRGRGCCLLSTVNVCRRADFDTNTSFTAGAARGSCASYPRLLTQSWGALTLALSQLRSLMNYATVAVFVVFPLSPSLDFHFHICLRESGRRRRAQICCLRRTWRVRWRMGARSGVCSCVVATIDGVCGAPRAHFKPPSSQSVAPYFI